MTPVYVTTGILILFLFYTFALSAWMRWAEKRANEIAETDPESACEMWDEVDTNWMAFPTHWVKTWWKWRA